MPTGKVTVIGSGFSGLSSACYLAKMGYAVTVVEKHDRVGGRARSLSESGFVYDMGPSWYWMPDVFDAFFADFGKRTSDYYELIRLSPSYKVFFKDRVIDVPSDINELYALFESVEKGAGEKLKQFLKEAEYKYQVGMQDLVYRPGLSITEFMDMRFLKGLFKLDVLKSIHTHIRKYFKDPHLVQLLEFPVLFLGALPKNTPALYSLMNYADMVGGTWYPQGGMVKVVEAMHSLALELGVTFELNADVSRIEVEGHTAQQLKGTKPQQSFDALVSSADYQFTEQTLLDAPYRRYSSAYWESRKLAPSAILYYVGVDKPLDHLLHHNLFFDEDFEQHANDIYKDVRWPEKPLLYVSCSSKTDPTVAPAGQENLVILIPVAPGLEDTAEIRDRYFDLAVKRIESHIGMSFRENIVYRRDFCMRDFVKEYNSFKGNAYGLANTLLQTAILKPKLVSAKVHNLFYTGQFTVPGPGVPPCLISGKLAAEQVRKYLQTKQGS